MISAMQWKELQDMNFEPKKFQRELYLIDLKQSSLCFVLNYSENAISRLINGQWKQPGRWRRAITEFTARTIVAKALALGWEERSALECAKRALQGIEFPDILVLEDAQRYKAHWITNAEKSEDWLEQHPHPALAITNPTPKE